jgi:hypothetical protein
VLGFFERNLGFLASSGECSGFSDVPASLELPWGVDRTDSSCRQQ